MNGGVAAAMRGSGRVEPVAKWSSWRGQRVVALVALGLAAAGCQAQLNSAAEAPLATRDRVGQGEAASYRKIVQTGDLAVAVDSPDRAAREVERLVREAGGFVERSMVPRESRVSMQCRVPAARLEAIMEAIGALGDEERRSVSSTDVTDRYTDLETRLRNGRALRDRLRVLLGRASDVEDVLAIEKELTRVQSEVENLEALLKRLESEIELSALSVTLEPKQILGPLGYLAYGLWWAVSKLFVIR